MATTRSNRTVRRTDSRLPLIAGGVVLALIVIIALVLYLPPFLIKEVRVEGAQIIKEEDLKTEVNNFLAGNQFLIIPKRHIWFYPQEELAAHLLKTFPRLITITTTSGWSSELALEVSERSPVLLYCEPSDRCFFIDEMGVAYTRSPSFSPGVFLEWRASSTNLTAPINLSTKAEVERLLNLKQVILRVLSLLNLSGWQVNYFESTADHDFIFTVTPTKATSTKLLPWRILVDEEVAAVTVGNNLHAALSAILKESLGHSPTGEAKDKTFPRLQYVDVRFGKKVFYKL